MIDGAGSAGASSAATLAMRGDQSSDHWLIGLIDRQLNGFPGSTAGVALSPPRPRLPLLVVSWLAATEPSLAVKSIVVVKVALLFVSF